MITSYDNCFVGWSLVYCGKVRDMYVPSSPQAQVKGNTVLMVASDRISAFDHILSTEIPDKGKILTQMSLWWFEQLADLVGNHVVSTDVPSAVAGRGIICRRLEMFPVECVVRGYLTGSGRAEYVKTGSVCGIALPAGLAESAQLDSPIFTPARKAEVGEHDENIDFSQMQAIVGGTTAKELKELSLEIYDKAQRIAHEQGIIIADTKFEFGARAKHPTEILIADEVLTPDSSRFWLMDEYEVGKTQPSLDKQLVRNWLLSSASGWDKDSDAKPPALPLEIVEKTRERYIQVYERLTGQEFVS